MKFVPALQWTWPVSNGLEVLEIAFLWQTCRAPFIGTHMLSIIASQTTSPSLLYSEILQSAYTRVVSLLPFQTSHLGSQDFFHFEAQSDAQLHNRS